ncbi:MAG: hypothetical protein A3F17_00045 [Gammaproteobacteria bacterium RIFCSPHIGHO2_12_FULL_41_15]|nr:MAG: hypothetical protein A3F17_00045 [Gammaproteobacteria bacterium RIFCSPHIGHO2_12_FULL_41_15]
MLKKFYAFLLSGVLLLTAVTTLAEGQGTISFLSSAPLKPGAACELRKSDLQFKGLINKLDFGPDLGQITLLPENIRVLKSNEGFYISYYQGVETLTVDNKVVERPVSFIGVGNDLNGAHYFVFRTPDCSGFLKIDYKDYAEHDYEKSAQAAVAKKPEEKRITLEPLKQQPSQALKQSSTAEGRLSE